MSRLIDADELIEIAHEMIQEDPDAFNGGYSYDAVTVEEINEAPTVEAVPVVHGEWILVSTNQPCDSYKCNKCGIVLSLWATDMKGMNYYRNFCPNCGADMRKKV